ncbi:MAG TPA: sortase [Candidatus Saccharimonadales bacterium]|nr:sortase [Candidatus Saccharimonadales bacterium]
MNKRDYFLPSRPTPKRHHQPATHQQAAADYLRQQVAQIYGDDDTQTPEVKTTLEQPAQHASTAAPQTYAHTYQAESKPYDWQTYHTAWQNYYRQYYERYYLQQASQQRQIAAPAESAAPQPAQTAEAKPQPIQSNPYETISQTLGGSVTPEATTGNQKAVQALKTKLLGTVGERAKKAKASPHFMPLITAIVVGLLFLFLQFNRTLVAQAKYFISPGTLTNDSSSIIINPSTVASVGQDPRIIIPKINVDVPVVYDEPSYDDKKIQKALQRGVVHYGTSAVPGQSGNDVIVGHSSNDLFDPGGYKFAFVLIDHLNNGDIFMLNYQGKRYVYKVYNKAVISPTDFSLININPDKPVVTLITCTPPGTALKRLVVQAEQISPDPDQSQVASSTPPQAASLPSTIPGNSPTLLERFKKLF